MAFPDTSRIQCLPYNRGNKEKKQVKQIFFNNIKDIFPIRTESELYFWNLFNLSKLVIFVSKLNKDNG